MKLFIVCISFFLSDFVFASGCELDNISCKFAAKIPYQDLIELSLWFVLSLLCISFIFFVYNQMNDALNDKSKEDAVTENKNNGNEVIKEKRVQEFKPYDKDYDVDYDQDYENK
jgi:hypothetical protein